VMAELEGMCGRLAARRITEWQRKALSDACDACAKAAAGGDTDAYYYENERFHYAIYAACGNHFLAEEAQRLHRRLKPYRRLQLRVPNRMKMSLAEHQAIVEAILSGESEGAETLLKAHVVVQGERFSDLVANLSRLDEAVVAAR
jgi:DNA-binding GntR family transcriptional regulator